MKKITKVSPKSLAKVFGAIYAFFGVIASLLLAFFSILAPKDESSVMFPILGIFFCIFIPIVYGLGGWIGGYISGWLYNIVVKRTGGIEVEIE